MSDKSDPRNVCSITGSRLSPIVIASLAFGKQSIFISEESVSLLFRHSFSCPDRYACDLDFWHYSRSPYNLVAF